MKSFFRNFRYAAFLVSIMCILLGLAVILWPDNAMKVMCYGFGAVLVLAGLLQVAAFLLGERTGLLPKLMMLAAFMSIVVGVWLLFSPDKVTKLAMIVLGVVLLYHGFMDIKYGFDIKGWQAKGSAMAVFFGVATCAFGVLMLVNPFQSAETLFFVAGLGFLFDGVTDFITVFAHAGASVHYERISSAAPVIQLEPGAAQTLPLEGGGAQALDAVAQAGESTAPPPAEEATAPADGDGDAPAEGSAE